jgi:flagellar motor switch protein FliN/FliY
MEEIKKAEFSQMEAEVKPTVEQVKNPMERIAKIMDVTLNASVELGRSKLTIEQAINTDVGSIIELDKIAGEPVDLFVNDNLFGRGEVVVIGEKYGIRITELHVQKDNKEVK